MKLKQAFPLSKALKAVWLVVVAARIPEVGRPAQVIKDDGVRKLRVKVEHLVDVDVASAASKSAVPAVEVDVRLGAVLHGDQGALVLRKVEGGAEADLALDDRLMISGWRRGDRYS